ncbi:MAG: hypothetical protein HY876_08085, partial [Coriobacteriales bacterium]|nr:hypothetical protein [Coriobacteriales bacterium]
MHSEIAQITEVPAGIERFARQLVVAWKAVLLYPPASAIPTETSEIAATTLREIVATDGEFSLSVQKNGLSWSGVPLKAQNSSFESFAVELYQRSLAEIRFHADADRASIATFLSVIATDSADIQAAGGIEASLTNAGLHGISVLEARVAIVDADTPTAAMHEPSVAEVDSLVSSALSGGTEDLRRLVRMVGEVNAAHAWLAASSTRGFDPMRAGDRVVELAQAAMRLPAEERSRFQQGIGDALLSLPEDQTAALLRDRLLPSARKDAAAATIVAAIGLDDLCRALVSPG